MKEIIVINGVGACGKDTFVSLVSKYAKVTNFSTIDKIKEIARLAGWNDEKDEKSRNFLHDLKTLVSSYNDLPFICTKKAVEEFMNSDQEILFIHIREPENIERTVLEFNAKSLLIKRTNYEDMPESKVDSNALVENYSYDYIIVNDTLEDLETKAKDFVIKLKNN